MKTIAFFDLDYTLLDTSSGLMYAQQIVRQRRAPLWLMSYLSTLYHLKRITFAEAHARLIPFVGRHGVAEAKTFFDAWVSRHLTRHLTEKGRQTIAQHQQQGHEVVIISASIKEIVRPIAEHLDLANNYLSTHLATDGDRYTGAIDGLPCYGEGKVHWAKQWCADNGFDFAEAAGYFYTDSSSDVPLLNLVRHPIAVNPSRKLAKIATQQGWPIEYFYKPTLRGKLLG